MTIMTVNALRMRMNSSVIEECFDHLSRVLGSKMVMLPMHHTPRPPRLATLRNAWPGFALTTTAMSAQVGAGGGASGLDCR